MTPENLAVAHEIAPRLLRLLDTVAAMVGSFGGPGRMGVSVELIAHRVGRPFHPAPLPGHVPRAVPMRCFENAANLAIRDPGLAYAEGVALDPGIPLPVHHAWVVDPGGRVVDPTWPDPERCEYIGIAFTRGQVARERRRTGRFGMLDTGSGLNWRVINIVDPALAQECRIGGAA